MSTSPALKLSSASRLVVEQFQALVPGRWKIRHERMIVDSATLTLLHHLLLLVDDSRRIVPAVDDPTMAASLTLTLLTPQQATLWMESLSVCLSVCALSPIESGLLTTGRHENSSGSNNC